MKILVVTDKYAPHAGGSAVVLSEWCRRWPARDVRVIASTSPGWQEYDKTHPVAIRRVSFPDIPKLRMAILWLKLWVRSLVECIRWRPDLVLYGQVSGTTFLAPLLSLLINRPFGLNLYGEELAIALRSRWAFTLYKWLLAHTRGATVCSTFTEALLRNEFHYRLPILTVFPGVDVRLFSPGNRELARESLSVTGKPILLTAGRLMRRKGHDMVLEALVSLKEAYPDIQYLIVGEGPARRELEALVNTKGLSKQVLMLGKVNQEDLVRAYRSADIFVHPNRELANGDVEGFGIVFLEAGACQVPVVGGRSGGAVDAVSDGETGFLIDPGNVRDLVAKVRILLEDPSRAVQMGERGRHRALSLGWDDAASRVWEFLGQLCANQSRKVC